MTKITWLGEDTDDSPGPSFLTWNGVRFPKGQAVDVDIVHMISKAKQNFAFKVDEGKQEKAHVEKVKEGDDEEKQKEQSKEKQEHDYRQSEKGTGYTPIKKKVRKKKAGIAPDPAVRTDADA